MLAWFVRFIHIKEMNKTCFLTSILFISLSFAACVDEPVIPEPEPEPPKPEDTVVVDMPYSGTLPVLFINTEDSCEIVSKDEYVNAEWWLDNLGDEQFESIGTKDAPMNM